SGMDDTPQLKWNPIRDQIPNGYQGPMVASGDARVGACIGIVPENFETFMNFSPSSRMAFAIITPGSTPRPHGPQMSIQGDMLRAMDHEFSPWESEEESLPRPPGCAARGVARRVGRTRTGRGGG